MNSVVLQAASQSSKPRVITTPKGYKLKWTKPSDPTADDWARLKAWDDAQPVNPDLVINAAKGLAGAATGLVGGRKQSPQEVAASIPRTPMGSPDVARMTPEQKNLQFRNATPQQVIDKSNQNVSAIAEYLAGTKFGALANAQNQMAFGPFNQAMKGRSIPVPIMGDVPVQIPSATDTAATIAGSPGSILADSIVLGHPDSTLKQRAGAFANIATQVGGLDTLLAQSAWKGAKALATAIKEGKKDRIAALYESMPTNLQSQVQLKLRENFGRQDENVRALPAAEPKLAPKAPETPKPAPTKGEAPRAGGANVDRKLVESGATLDDDGIGHMITPSGKGVKTKPSPRGGFDNHWEVAADAGLIPKEWRTMASPPVSTQSIVNGMLKDGWIRWHGGGNFEFWGKTKQNLSTVEKRLINQNHPRDKWIYIDDASVGTAHSFKYGDFVDNDFNLGKTLSKSDKKPYNAASPLDFSKYAEAPKPAPAKPVAPKTAKPKAPVATGLPEPAVDFESGKNVHFGPGTRPLTEGEIAKSAKKVGTNPSSIPPKPKPGPTFEVGDAWVTPKGKPAPVAPETPKTTVPEAPVAPETGKTSISLAEAARHDLSPDAPSPQSWDQWQSEAVARGHNTPEGVDKILAKAKKGVEPTPDETFGLGMHVADLLETAGKATGEERTKLIDRAREIYAIRHTQSARNIAARAALHQGEYKPQMVDALYELETGKPPDPKTSTRINKQAQRIQDETANIERISSERKGLRNAAVPKFVEKGTPEQRIAKARTVIEKKYPRRLTGGYIDPEMLGPVAAMLRAKTEQLRGNVSRAVVELRNELAANYGWKVTDDELLEAFKDVRKKRSLTEAEIRSRNARARATSAINREIEAASQPTSVKFARGVGRFSQEMRMADVVNRGIDFTSNADEVIQSSVASPFERLAANAYLAATKDPTRFRGMSVGQRAAIASRWASETGDAIADAAGASGSRQSGHFTAMGTLAGILDSPTRAFNELRYAGEIAADIVKKNPKLDFADVVDQIRQPALGGPLDADLALRHHENMYKWGDVAMHTDENAISKIRGGFRGMFANATPSMKAVGETLDWFVFSFSKSLLNIADKAGQATVLPYGVARAAQTAGGMTLTKNLDKAIRAKQLAQIVRRTAVGYGLVQMGYYWPEIQAYAKENGIDAPDQPDWMKGRIIETLDKDQKPSGNIYHEESYPAQVLGVMFAMSAGAKARKLDDFEAENPSKKDQIAGLKRKAWLDPVFNNTAWNQVGGLLNLADPKTKADAASQSMIGMLVRMFTPSGFAKWAKSEDAVPSRQTKPQKSDGMQDWIMQAIWNEMKNRAPTYWGTNPENRQTLPPKSQVIK